MLLFTAETSPVTTTSAALQTRLPPGAELDQLGDRLRKAYAGRGDRRLLVLFQAVNAAGKDGAIAELGTVLGSGSFRVERFRRTAVPDRDLLAEAAGLVPGPAEVVLFNRTYYEAPLAAALQRLPTVPDLCGRIVAFEEQLTDADTTVCKLFLHIDKHVQLERLGERQRRPELGLHNPYDYDDQPRWDDLMRAYDAIMAATHTASAPWFVVPGNDRAVRNRAIQQILVDALSVDHAA